MPIANIIRAKVRYIAIDSESGEWKSRWFYDVLIMQKGEGFIIKRVNESSKNVSRLTYDCLDDLLQYFDICSKEMSWYKTN